MGCVYLNLFPSKYRRQPWDCWGGVTGPLDPADGSNVQNASSSSLGGAALHCHPPCTSSLSWFPPLREEEIFVRMRRVCDTNYSPFYRLQSFQSCRSLKRLQVLFDGNPAVLTRKGSLKTSASEKKREKHGPLSTHIFLRKCGYYCDAFTNE